MITQPAEIWRALLRRSLLAARTERDPTRVSALRSMLAAIDNAEAPPSVGGSATTNAHIAGAVTGVGTTEVARRELSDEQIRELVCREVDERLGAADDFTTGGHTERAAALRAEATVLRDLLGDV